MDKQLTTFKMKQLPDGSREKRQWAIKIGDFYLHRDTWYYSHTEEKLVINVSWEGYSLISFTENDYQKVQDFIADLLEDGMSKKLQTIAKYQGMKPEDMPINARRIIVELLETFYRYSSIPKPTSFIQLASEFDYDYS